MVTMTTGPGAIGAAARPAARLAFAANPGSGRLLRWAMLVAALLVALAGGPASADTPWTPDARLSVTVDRPDRPILAQEMVLIRITGLYRVPITLEKLLVPEMPGFRFLQVGPDRWSEVMAEGLPTRSFQRTLALFPQKSGRLTIPAFIHRLTIVRPDGKRVGHDVTTVPLPLDVEPAPVTAGTWWLPARSVTVTDSWSVPPEALAIGQSTRRTVTVVAEGVTDDQLPATPSQAVGGLIVFAGAPARSTVIGVSTRETGEQRRQRLGRPGRLAFVEGDADGPIATVTYSWSIRPASDQPAEMPDIEIPWFDTTTGTLRTAILPGLTVALAQAGRSMGDLEADLGLVPVASAVVEQADPRIGYAAFGAAFLAGATAMSFGLGSRARRWRGWLSARRLALWSALLDRLPGVAPATRWRAADRAGRAAESAGLTALSARQAEAKARTGPALFGPQAS